MFNVRDSLISISNPQQAAYPSLVVRSFSSEGRNRVIRAKSLHTGKVTEIFKDGQTTEIIREGQNPEVSKGNEAINMVYGNCYHSGINNADLNCDLENRFWVEKNFRDLHLPNELRGSSASGLEGVPFYKGRPNFLSAPRVMNVLDQGVQNDGSGDQSGKLNRILKEAAQSGVPVFFPAGRYAVRDTLHVPGGSRIFGEVWPQIIGQGPKFADEKIPQPVARVGNEGEVCFNMSQSGIDSSRSEKLKSSE
jgi:hypothetical protein